MTHHRLPIHSLRELRAQEHEVLERLRAMPNGERLFLAHPLRALSDAGLDLSDETRAEIVRLHPHLGSLPETPYNALQATHDRQGGAVRLHGLFDWERS